MRHKTKHKDKMYKIVFRIKQPNDAMTSCMLSKLILSTKIRFQEGRATFIPPKNSTRDEIRFFVACHRPHSNNQTDMVPLKAAVASRLL